MKDKNGYSILNEQVITENNYKVIGYEIIEMSNKLDNEFKINAYRIGKLKKIQSDIKKNIDLLSDKMEMIVEFSEESEVKFIAEIERKCTRCGKIYDKRKSTDKLCVACFTSNS